MTIRILCFDFDGCLFHLDYINSSDKDVIAHNKEFLDKLASQSIDFKQVYTSVGSTRQSVSSDYSNSIIVKNGLIVGNKGSCFPAIKKIADYLKAEHDPFLLADVFGDLPEGTSFNRAINPDNKESHSHWLYDESKFIILYAQMHHFARKHPKEELIFDFFDDRSLDEKDSLNILQNLKDYFSRNQQMIPPNLTLRLNHYKGKAQTLIAEIKGDSTSFIDENYAETVKEVAHLASANGQADGRKIPLHTLSYAEPKDLESRAPSLFYLKKNLEEMRTGENTLSANAQLVIDALGQVDSSNFSREEFDLLNEAKYYFAVIAKEKRFWDAIIPKNLENLNPKQLSAIFVNLSSLLENPEQHEPIYERLSSCGWATNNYLALSKLLAKNNNQENINQFLRQKGERLPIDALIITPFQRLPRLALFSCDWVKALESFPDSFSGKKAAISFKRKFKRLLSSLNQISKLIEEQNKLKVKNPISLADSFFDLFKIETNQNFQPYIDPQALLAKKFKQDLIQSYLQNQEETINQDDLEDKREELEIIEKKLKDLSLSYIRDAENSSPYDFTRATSDLSQDFRKMDENKEIEEFSSLVGQSTLFFSEKLEPLNSTLDPEPKEKLFTISQSEGQQRNAVEIPEIALQKESASKIPETPNTKPITASKEIDCTSLEVDTQRITTSTKSERDLKKIITKAAIQGIKNYLDWSEKGIRNRGAQGWFTKLRHGQDGRDQARGLASKLGGDSPAKAIIDNFLNNPYTRFNNHSLASYLLDSLTAIENSPWQDTSGYPEYTPFDGEEETSCCCF